MSLWSRLFGNQPIHTTEPPSEIQNNIATGKAIMLDVRSQQEWDAGHLRDVIFIPITDLKSLPPDSVEVNGLEKSKIIYCH